MKVFGKGLVLGVVLLVVTGGTATALVGSSFGWEAWTALIVVGLGWHLINVFLISSATRADSAIQSTTQHTSLIEQFSNLQTESAAQCAKQLEIARGEIARVQTLLSEAITTLTDSFASMNNQISDQRDLAISVTDGAGGNSAKHFDEFVADTANVMDEIVNSILENSKLGVQLVNLTAGISESMHGIQSILAEIGGIAKQTNLLALNASIEAARAGESGRGFAVVADEVRDLSTRTTQFSQEINALISGMEATVKQTESSIQQMVGQDMTFAFDSKARVQSIVEMMNGQARTRLEALAKLSEIAGQVEIQVGRAVTSLQFQDMVSQLLAHVGRRLDAVDQVSHHLGDLAKVVQRDIDTLNTQHGLNALREEAARVEECLKGLSYAAHHNPVDQSAMTKGDVELF